MPPPNRNKLRELFDHGPTPTGFAASCKREDCEWGTHWDDEREVWADARSHLKFHQENAA